MLSCRLYSVNWGSVPPIVPRLTATSTADDFCRRFRRVAAVVGSSSGGSKCRRINTRHFVHTSNWTQSPWGGGGGISMPIIFLWKGNLNRNEFTSDFFLFHLDLLTRMEADMERSQ